MFGDSRRVKHTPINKGIRDTKINERQKKLKNVRFLKQNVVYANNKV